VLSGVKTADIIAIVGEERGVWSEGSLVKPCGHWHKLAAPEEDERRTLGRAVA